MGKNTTIVHTLRDYFQEKGVQTMSASEYSRQADAPIRIQQLRNIFGTWNKVEKLVMATPGEGAMTNINDVIEARNRTAAAEEAERKANSEDLVLKFKLEDEALQAANEKIAATRDQGGLSAYYEELKQTPEKPVEEKPVEKPAEPAAKTTTVKPTVKPTVKK